jgi:sensor histidine kinase YesM
METVGLQTRYESEQKEKQIENLSRENEFQSLKLRQSRIFLFGLTGLVALVIILTIMLIRQNRLRERQKNLILQQRLFRSQMNPHFIFNSLSSIHNFMINEKTTVAATYLSKFSKLIRTILHSSVEEYNSLDKEISTMENYLEIHKLRFPEKYDFRIETDKELDPENISIPSMITQPFIENAIEHGIKHKSSKGNIHVRFSQKDGMILIEIEDDGVGRAKAKEILSAEGQDHKPLSISIIRERIKVLNRSLKKKITLGIQDLKDERGEPAGTKVMLEVPLM